MFSTQTLSFLSDLKDHNERAWFEANKLRYERDVKAPLQNLMVELSKQLPKVSKQIVVDPRPVGGSAMRIYRDLRFSKDKSPYKPYLSAKFWHARGKDSAAPGFYLHVEPGKSMIGGGVWHPEVAQLKKIRDAIAKKPNQWKSATSGLLRRSACGMIGESLKRPPPGYNADHALIEDIKRKDFCVSMMLSDEDVVSKSFAQKIVEGARRMTPFMAFLAKAVGVPY